ncbi:MAG: hypothetical protein JXB88_25310 [Spirochaetales bacterium]|nr:hypothetical protein [Spirochaetales bacterium]
MKKLCFTGIIFLVVPLIVLVSCFTLLEEKPEGIEISIAPTRQIYTEPGDYYAQVYLLVNKGLIPLGKKTDYVEKNLDKQADQNRIVVENIPAGRYVVWLGIGTKRPENGAFNVQYYYESEEFELVAGSTTKISCTLLDCPFDKALTILGENINGAVIDSIGGQPAQTLYASGPKNLYSFSGTYHGPDFTVTEVFDASDFPNYSINSVSKGLNYTGTGAPENYLFLSTTQGISKTNGLNTIDNTFSVELGEINVLKSLAYPDGNNVSVFFQRDGGLGGVYQDGPPANLDWADADYSDMLKDQLVWDFCVTDNLEGMGIDNCGYFATVLGTLRIPQMIIEDYEEGNEVYLMEQAEFFAIKDKNNHEIPIFSLGYDPDEITPANSTLYMGTYKGLYSALVGTITPLNGKPELLEETKGTRIYMVLLNDDYRVYMSQTYLYLQEKSSDDVVSLPFVAGLPGVISAMDWDGNILVISGSLGIVALDVDTMF